MSQKIPRTVLKQTLIHKFQHFFREIYEYRGVFLVNTQPVYLKSLLIPFPGARGEHLSIQPLWATAQL